MLKSEQKRGYRLDFISNLFDLIHLLFTCFSTDTAEKSMTLEEDSLQTILRYIDEHYSQSLGLEELAAQVYTTPQYLSKRFKQKVGIGFHEYLSKLRLEHAVSRLIFTSDSITKIALESGFPSAKAFNNQFKKVYGEAPGSYRSRYKDKEELGQEERALKIYEADGEDGQMVFLKYLSDYQLSVTSLQKNLEKISLKLPELKSRPFKKPQYLLDIETFQAASRQEILDLLRITCESIPSAFVYFSLFAEAWGTVYEEGDTYQFYAEYRSFEHFYQLGLTPFIALDFSRARERVEKYGGFPGYYNYFCQLITYMKRKFPQDYLAAWQFEFIPGPLGEDEGFWDFCRHTTEILGELGVGQVGLCLCDGENFNQEEIAPWLDKYLAFEPSFFTFGAYPEKESAYLGKDDYWKLADFHLRRTLSLKEILKRCGLGEKPLYMTKWNTIKGEGAAQSGAFFRSAIILDTYLQLADEVAGIGVHLNTFEPSLPVGRSDTGILALFLLYRVKRPVFFILEAIKRLGGESLYHSERLFLTRLGDDEFILALLNPQYIAPLYSVDPAYTEALKIRLEVELEGLTPGRYLSKRFAFDNKGAGVFNHWQKSGFPDFFDQDVINYLESAIVPELVVNEVETGGDYEIQTDLEFNGVLLYHLKKI